MRPGPVNGAFSQQGQQMNQQIPHHMSPAMPHMVPDGPGMHTTSQQMTQQVSAFHLFRIT